MCPSFAVPNEIARRLFFSVRLERWWCTAKGYFSSPLHAACWWLGWLAYSHTVSTTTWSHVHAGGVFFLFARTPYVSCVMCRLLSAVLYVGPNKTAVCDERKAGKGGVGVCCLLLARVMFRCEGQSLVLCLGAMRALRGMISQFDPVCQYMLVRKTSTGKYGLLLVSLLVQ